ncbi:MAG: SusD/RagB family nutrient-binding outer membrane lipoprotein [Bacteroidota bacterium]
MRTKIITALFFIAMFFVSSCTKNFEEINTDPNNPSEAPLGNVFAYVIKDITARFGSAEMLHPASYVGHITKGFYTDVSNYIGPPSASLWNGTYRVTMSNANFVLRGAEEEGYNNLRGATLVLKAYAMQMVTDAYGQAPYFEAGLGSEGIITPSYDTEKEIYYDLLQQLEYANELLVDTAILGPLEFNDILYNGNIEQWKKFCNSLHLRLAIRISNIDESTASAEISKILNDPVKYPILESNSDNALLAYPGGEWVEPWTQYHKSINDNRMAKPLVDTLLNYADPRLAFYADTIDDGTYKGLEVGAQYTHLRSHSKIDALFVENELGPVFLMKYAEVEFIKAEAMMRGFAGGVAQDAYEAGITASCEEYGISSDDITTYLEGPEVVWADDINQIYLQKWISLFRQSWEAWAEMRRTDIPKLSPAVNSSVSGHNRPPFRFSYPDLEVKLNGANIPAAVVEDDHYWGYQIWWDTRTGVQ